MGYGFEYNETFLQWLQDKLPQPEYDIIYHIPASTHKQALSGRLAKVWRWFHGRMEATAKQYGTVTHADIANEIVSRGWRIVDIPERKVSRGYRMPIEPDMLAREIAYRIGDEISQLSDKTQISTIYRHGERFECSYHEPLKLFKWDEYEPSPIAPTMDYKRYTVEWKEFVYRVANYPQDNHYYVAVAYDRLNDMLYVDYR
jgi:hypothetical protein